jgi:acetyl-CoA carboxylase carboxyl transferase subunit beta
MPFFSKPKYATVTPPKKKDIPKDLYTRCPVTGEIVYSKELEKNLMVVAQSGYHFPISAPARIESLVDQDSFVPYDDALASVDILKFKDLQAYEDRLRRYRQQTGLNDAVVCGVGTMAEIPVSLAVMDFRFGGGGMGSVVGEKITRAIERATAQKIPLVIICASGGARMQEGIFSLMQMAKTSAALARYRECGAPYVAVLTNPTTGGVSASFATLGDLIIAEPGALIGFAGPRVIREGTKQELPEDFQTAEFLVKHGLVDQIVPRTEMRQRLIYFFQTFYSKKRPAEAFSQA